MSPLQPGHCNERSCFCFSYKYIIILNGLNILEYAKFCSALQSFLLIFFPLLKSRVIGTNYHLLLYQLTVPNTPNLSRHICQMGKGSKINMRGGEERMDYLWENQVRKKVNQHKTVSPLWKGTQTEEWSMPTVFFWLLMPIEWHLSLSTLKS